MSQYGLLELRRGERRALEPQLPNYQARLGVSLTGLADEGTGAGP